MTLFGRLAFKILSLSINNKEVTSMNFKVETEMEVVIQHH